MSERDQLFEAIKSDDLSAVTALLRANPALAAEKNAQGLSPILFARYHRRNGLLPTLKAAKPSLDLFEAAALGQSDQIKRLVQTFSADPNSHSPDGFTPLQLACFFGNLDAVKALIQIGANVNAVSANPMKLTALHSAAAGETPSVIEALLEAGANPDARQNGGWTALHAAAGQGNGRLVQLLLRYKADPNPAADDGLTPAGLAAQKGHKHLLDLLK